MMKKATKSTAGTGFSGFFIGPGKLKSSSTD
jgi:hypothetical protein